jgi:acetolactate synthase-1/2/3 large subunit
MDMESNSEKIVDALRRLGTRYVFGYPGAQNLRFIEALHGSPVPFVLVTHEACAGFMADISARITGKPGACLSTLGPGATNMSTGIGNAYLDRVPVLAFTARMGRSWRNRTVQMQIDHQRLFSPITKWSVELEGGKIYPLLKKAAEIALAEVPGPVHLDLPEDVAEELSPETGLDFHPSSPSGATFDEISFQRALELIRRAEYPLIAVGLTMNRARATAELREFVHKHNLPVVCTLMAKGQIEESDPHFVGVLGRARRDIVAEYCERADLVIAFGYDPVEFNYEEWLKKSVPLVFIDTVPADIAPDYLVPCGLTGDIRAVLNRLLQIPALEHRWDDSARQAHRQKLFRSLTPKQKRFSPHRALLIMREILPPDGILVSDIGAHTHLIGQLWDTKGTGNFLVTNGWSSMGFAVPAAVAAKLLLPERPVMACLGDGGFMMTGGEINTAVRLSLPIIFVVFRDNFLSLIKVKQARRKFHSSGVELVDSDCAWGHNFLGAKVVSAEDEDGFREALKQGLESDGPLIIETRVDPSEYETLL